MSLRRGLFFGLLVGLVATAARRSGRFETVTRRATPLAGAIDAGRREAAAVRTRERRRFQEARRRGAFSEEDSPGSG